MAHIAIRGKPSKPAPHTQKTRLSKSEIDQIKRIAVVRHGRALLRALIDYYDCETTELRGQYFDRKLRRIFVEFDDMEKSDLARDATQLIRDLTDLYGTDGLKKEINLAFSKRG